MMRFLLLSMLWSLVLAQDHICPPGEEFWPHSECSKFYICNNGFPIVGECPAGLYWHQALPACDFSNQVPECQGGTRPPVGNTTVVSQPTTAFPIINGTTTASPIINGTTTFFPNYKRYENVGYIN